MFKTKKRVKRNKKIDDFFTIFFKAKMAKQKLYNHLVRKITGKNLFGFLVDKYKTIFILYFPWRSHVVKRPRIDNCECL